MKIAVCAKQIPDPASPTEFDPETYLVVRPMFTFGVSFGAAFGASMGIVEPQRGQKVRAYPGLDV